MASESRRGRSDLGPKINEMPSKHLHSSNVVSNVKINHTASLHAEKGDFYDFTCIRNEGVARGLRRGRKTRDLGTKIKGMPSAHL